MPWADNIAKTMTSNGKQFSITRKILTAVARDRRRLDVVAGISARFSKFGFALFCYILTNHLMFGPSGKQNSLFPSGPVFKCKLDQKCLGSRLWSKISYHERSATSQFKSRIYADLIQVLKILEGCSGCHNSWAQVFLHCPLLSWSVFLWKPTAALLLKLPAKLQHRLWLLSVVFDFKD